MKLSYLVSASALLLASASVAQSPEQVAEAALEAEPVYDGHNDVPIQLRWRWGNEIGERRCEGAEGR